MKHYADLLDAHRERQQQANLVFQPLFYRLQLAGDREKFESLLATPGISVADHIFDQYKELVRYKNPSIRFSATELEAETKKYLAGKALEEQGVWVYYPWSNRLVHTLDEEDFINIRTSRNQYKITREERDVLMQKKIGVIGLSVGQSVSVTVAMERICGELRLADFDTLELNNLNRIRAGIHNLGLPKVYSVAREIAEIDPYLKVTCFTEGLSEENMDDFFTGGGRLDLLIEESDGFDIKILSRYKARDLKIPVLMEASDRCAVDVERFDLEPERGILHGIVKHLDIDTLKSLKTNEEKIPYMLDVLGIETSSIRLKASMVEMNQSINTWPQLASAVTMGGGITADVARRLLLNQYTESGRYHIDIEELIGNKKKEITPELPVYQPLSAEDMKKLCEQAEGKEPSTAGAAELEKIAGAAGLAPSYANKQPWRWASFHNQLFLFADRQQSHAFIDPRGIGANTALGAALENAALKAGELGLEASIRLFPLPGQTELVASIYFTKAGTSVKNDLGNYMALRHTNYRVGTAAPLAPEVLKGLTAAAAGVRGVNLEFVTARETITLLAQAAGVAERIRLLHPQANRDCFLNELKWAQPGEQVQEGINMSVLELPTLADTAFKVVSDKRVANLLYKWEKGIAFEKMAAATLGSASAIGLITARGDSAEAMIDAGRAAQRVWLAATKNSLAFQPICIPLYLLNYLESQDKSTLFSTKIISELEHIKKQFLQAFPTANLHRGVFLFRLSVAEAPSLRSARKPLKEVYFKL